jgi:hypothetical protein
MRVFSIHLEVSHLHSCGMVLAGISATRQLVLARWLSSFQLAVTLPLASGLDISKLERAVQTGRGNAVGLQGIWRTLCCQVKQNGSDIPRYTYWSLKQGYREGICAWGGACLQTQRGARGEVTSFLLSYTKKDGRRKGRLLTRDSPPPATVRGPTRLSPSPSGGQRLLHPHALARAV